MRQNRTNATLGLFLGGVIVTAFALMLTMATRGLSNLGDSRAALLLVFSGLALACELRPLRWLGPRSRGEVTASWTFLLAICFIAPIGLAATSAFIISLLADVLRRSPPVRALFNSSQVCVSVLVGLITVRSFVDLRLVNTQPSPGWIGAALVVGLIAFVTNSLFACTAIGLSTRQPVSFVLRSSMGISMGMDLMLIALAPAFVVVALSGVLVAILMAVTVWAIYKTAEVALGHRHEATHDLLTRLPNRRLFFEQADQLLAAASRTNENIAFLHIDLDGFKGINDQLGHKTGDLVLQEVADRLIRAVGPSDVVARLGGDEFAVMLRPPSNIADAKVVANSIRELFNEPMMIETLPLVVGGSIGISVYPEHGEDVDALLNNADAAMYRAKTTHTGSAETFDVSTDRFRPARFRLVGEVTRAIANNELELRYQPKMDLTAGTIIGVEALLRWRHPSLGLLNPDAFMHTTEQTELMHDLTKYVIREALEQTSRWHDEGWLLSVAVNVSARNLHDRRFPDVVETLLTNANVNGGWLELEITENSVMTDPERSARVLARLRELGVQISIDDFGTGYSSLARLRTLPVDRVKIDRSFVTSMATTPQDASIVQSIIQLASNLGLGTIAEGVETPEVLAMLQELGCQVAQGFLIGEPVPASELPNLIERMQEQRFGITQRGDTR